MSNIPPIKLSIAPMRHSVYEALNQEKQRKGIHNTFHPFTLSVVQNWYDVLNRKSSIVFNFMEKEESQDTESELHLHIGACLHIGLI
ncbi:MAG TPA: hypothetical protein DEP37_01365 [Algoriphagus sp.]|nr:hypothetical protein [Algoriphagus sp.]